MYTYELFLLQLGDSVCLLSGLDTGQIHQCDDSFADESVDISSRIETLENVFDDL